MSKWVATIDVSEWWKDDFFTETERIQKTARRVEMFSINWDGDYAEELADIAEELTDAAESEDVEWFDIVWGAFYDWADDMRVWVKTF